jgi:hypothetical protein
MIMGLLSWYKLDGDAVDSWGSSDGTVTGTMTYPDCVIEEGMHVTGQANNRIDVMTSPFTTQASFTIACWVYIPSSYTWNTLSTNGIVAAGSYAGGHGLVRQANVDNSIGMYIRTTTQTRLAVTPITRDTWYHIVGVFNAIDQELKIYKNGVLIDTTVTTFPNESLDASVFILGGGITLGGNVDPNRYFEGDIDGVRFFDHALSGKEVKKLSQAKIFHLKLDGDATDCSMYEHNGTVDGGILSEYSVIGSGCWAKITNIDDIATSLLPDSQNITYAFWFKPTGTGGTLSEAVLGHRSSDNGFMFYRNDGNTDTVFYHLKYYTTTTPSSGTVIVGHYFPVDVWYHVVCAYDEDGNYKMFFDGVKTDSGTASLFDYWDDGVTFDVGHSGSGGYISYRGFIDDIQIFNTYLSDVDCIVLHEERASLDNEGSLHGVEFVETKYQPLLTNYTVWEDGQTGSVGSFIRNGTDAENAREDGTGPFGNTIPLWKAIPDAGDDADGGWNHSLTTADKTKCYRYSVWIKRTGTSEGTTYLGCQGNDVKDIITGVVNSNPYFYARNPSNYTDWFLYVGHIREHDTTETSFHPDSGIYNTDGVKVLPTQYDYKWIDGTVEHKHRSYLYYCTLTTNRQYWAYPRIDVCDGTEPTIADLIGGLDGRYFDYVNSLNGTTAQPMSITSSQVLVSNMSEVGAVEGLVAWYPLNGNPNYLVGANNGVVTDATIVTGNKDLAYNFNGTTHKIEVVDSSDLEPTTNLSVSFWFKMDSWTSLRQILCVKWYGYSCEIGTDQKMYFRVYHETTTTTDSPKTTSIVSTGVWHHFVGTYNTSTGTSMYFDNVDYGTTATTGAVTYNANPLRLGRYSDTLRLLGDLRDVRIYDKVLSVEEVGMLYATTGGTTTRMTQTTNTVAVKSEFNEV